MSVQIHAIGNVFAVPREYVVWVLKDPDFYGQKLDCLCSRMGRAAFI